MYFLHSYGYKYTLTAILISVRLAKLLENLQCLYCIFLWLVQDPTATETFEKKPKLAKLLRELKSTPVSRDKKDSLVFIACL